MMNFLETDYYRHNGESTLAFIFRAVGVCYVAHQAIGQKRKFTGEDYYNHSLRVAQMMIDYQARYGVVVAALLHDVIEDTGLTVQDLKNLGIPDQIIENVCHLSEDKSIKREIRKADTAERAKTWPTEVCTVKLGDIIDNYGSMELDVISPWKEMYFAEGQRLVDSITSNENAKNIPAGLLNKARQAVDRINTVIPS